HPHRRRWAYPGSAGAGGADRSPPRAAGRAAAAQIERLSLDLPAQCAADVHRRRAGEGRLSDQARAKLASELIPTRTRRRGERGVKTIEADVCVLGAGISGVAAALEAARLGRKVIIVDGAPALGGQAIGSIIGTLIGLYTHGPQAYQITHLV